MNASTKKSPSFTTTISVDQTPQQAFAAINDVGGWWSGEIVGTTDQVGGEFTYRYKKLHSSKQKVTELVPGKRVVWLVVDSHLDFTKDKQEWTGTRMIFDIARKGDQTEVRFTHEGLVPTLECYDACFEGWTSLVEGNLRGLMAAGKERPDARERTRASTTRRGNGSQTAM
jgi:hypothetical protein